MNENLKQKLQNLPKKPGIYQYFDNNGKLLYIGKAKILHNRVKSYFKFTPTLQPSPKLGARIFKMISEVNDLNYIIVNSENDALILENSLIKQLNPKYNILLRDDKTYPYIYVDLNEDFPRLEITRKILKSKNIKYYGPFSTGARDILTNIYKIIPLVQKKGSLKNKKACMFYQIKQCMAPCENKISKQEYKILLNEAIDLLTNKTKLIEKLTFKMNQYSEDFRFEEALNLRDNIASIKKSQLKSTLDFAKNESFDLFYVHIENKRAVILKMFIRDGKLISTNHSFVNTTDITTIDEIYETALINYYTNDIPTIVKTILLPYEIKNKQTIEQFISNKYNTNISIVIPKIGLKKQLLDIAYQNTLELLKNNNSNNSTLYNSLVSLFNLSQTPYRFESFDNSQMMGQAKVGAMIVWDQDKFIKDDYRLYNLEALSEYEQMRELLTRRVNSFENNPPPHLWVIDGGKALLSLAYDITNSFGVNLDIIAISKEKIDAKAHRAKGLAKDIIYTKTDIFKLESSDKRLQFIQRLRDEAHRSAITFHKKQKRIEDKQISLLDIEGIGPAKIKKLINYFGSFDNIKKATQDELNIILNKTDSKNIFDFCLKFT